MERIFTNPAGVGSTGAYWKDWVVPIAVTSKISPGTSSAVGTVCPLTVFNVPFGFKYSTYCDTPGARSPAQMSFTSVRPVSASYRATVTFHTLGEGCTAHSLSLIHIYPGAGAEPCGDPRHRTEHGAGGGAVSYTHLYWGCYKRFFLLYFPYLLTVGLLVTACAVSAAPAYWQWLLTGQAAGPPQPLAAAAQVTLAFSVLWGLALAVYNGNTFNRALYEARAGKPYLRRRVLPVLALLAAGLALAAVLAGGYARLTLRALWTPGYRLSLIHI